MPNNNNYSLTLRKMFYHPNENGDYNAYMSNLVDEGANSSNNKNDKRVKKTKNMNNMNNRVNIKKRKKAKGGAKRKPSSKKKKTVAKKKAVTKKKVRKIHKGPRGGKYYITKGRKVYL